MRELVVFTEGKNDTRFLDYVISDRSPSTDVDIFDIVDLGNDTQRGGETQKLREFNERFNPYDILLKSEGGRTSLLRVFAGLVTSLRIFDFKYIVLVDLDNDSMTDISSQINSHLDGAQSGKDVWVESVGREKRSLHLVRQDFDLNIEGRKEDEFSILGFKTSLEDSLDMDSCPADEVDGVLQDGAKNDVICDELWNTMIDN